MACKSMSALHSRKNKDASTTARRRATSAFMRLARSSTVSIILIYDHINHSGYETQRPYILIGSLNMKGFRFNVVWDQTYFMFAPGACSREGAVFATIRAIGKRFSFTNAGRRVYLRLPTTQQIVATNAGDTRRVGSHRFLFQLVSARGDRSQIIIVVVESIAIDMIDVHTGDPGHDKMVQRLYMSATLIVSDICRCIKSRSCGVCAKAMNHQNAAHTKAVFHDRRLPLCQRDSETVLVDNNNFVFILANHIEGKLKVMMFASQKTPLD